jgi:tetratricopeptide (TPR) repeat protein
VKKESAWMARLTKWLALFGSIILLTSIIFLAYSHFLVDYSLENLGLALEVTNENPEAMTQASSRAYQNIIEDLVIHEATEEDIDFKSLALLELASRSLNEAMEKAGYPRANIYLNEVAKTKTPHRTPFLRVTDPIYRFLRRCYQLSVSVGTYFRKFLFREKEEPLEISSFILLTQAQENEKKWQLEDAARLYRKYMELYPKRSERPFVAISLAHVLIRQRNWLEAERVLHGIVRGYRGGREEVTASNLLKWIGALQNRARQIDQLIQLIPAYEGTDLGEKMQFKLALSYLSVHMFPQARETFMKLEKAQDVRLRQKAKFYIGWIHKLQSQYDQSAQFMLSLLEEKEIDRELRLGLEAQLADIYYQKKDMETSLAHYQTLAGEARQDLLARKAAVQAWIGLAEMEQGVIYHFNIGDRVQAQKFLTQAGQYFVANPKAGLLREKLQDVPYLGLRELAFRQLRAGRVHLALDLFRKNLILQPRDAWTHSGIGTVYILLADLHRASDYTEKGYELQVDEYTASVLGYLKGSLEKYEESIALYQEALGRNKDYIPPRYNLACMYLKIQEYDKALPLLRELDKTFEKVKTPMRSKVLNNLGFTLWWLGQREEAVKRFRQALEVTPGFIDAKKNLDQIALGRGSGIVSGPQPMTVEG